MELTGAGKIVFGLNENASLLLNPSQGGIGAIQGPTLYGSPGKAVFIANWQAFLREFGGYHPDSVFTAYIKLMLDAGAKFYVSRVNHYTDIDDNDSIQGTKATATLTVDTDSAVFVAPHIGAGYNNIKVTVSDAVSGTVGKIDITVERLDGYESAQTFRDVTAAISDAEKAALNAKIKHVQIGTVTNLIPNGNVTLATGAETIADIDAADYNGSAVSKTGLYSFSNAKEATRIINWVADPDIDNYYAAFSASTLRWKTELGVPVGASASGMSDYMKGENAYDHNQVNTWTATFNLGDMDVADPRNTDFRLSVPAVVAAFPSKLYKDAQGQPWLSTAILPEYAPIKIANYGVNLDLNSPENIPEYDLLSNSVGVNVITNDDIYGTIYHGNDSALIDKTSILKDENVADLILYIMRNLPQYVRTKQFRPNDPQMWQQLYLAVRPFIQTLATGRAIRPVEGEDWFWIGDQNVDDYKDVAFNSIPDIDAGKYKSRFVFIPISAAKYISIDFVPTDSNSITAVVNV